MSKKSKKSISTRTKSNRNGSLSFTSLESRQLLAGISFDAATGQVTVDGSAGNDVVRVMEDTGTTTVIFTGLETRSFDTANVSEIVFFGRNGDDWFRNDSSTSSKAFGQNGDDTLIGGSADDRLRGGTGSDRLYGMNGNDFIAGDDDNDFGWGGSGSDRLFGGRGVDRMSGEDGNDFMGGGDGDDNLYGGRGNDKVYGNSGNDRLFGELGDDLISGDDDNDSLYGGEGNDSMYGQNGDDSCDGGAGDDRILGGSGDDHLLGNVGMDVLFGQSGDDSLNGGDDNDRVNGDDGNDDVGGGNGDDHLSGGRGLDRLFGQNGRDRLNGDDDNDDLYGGLDDDILRGGVGNDDYFGDSSDTTFDDADDYASDGDFEVRAAISNLDTVNQTFTLLGLNVSYANAAVRTELVDGKFVKVEGALNGNSVTAYEIEAEDENSQENFEARGAISNLNTTAMTFDFLGLVVDYSSAAVPQTLANGQLVEVEGTLQGNTVIAHSVGDDSHRGGGLNDVDGTMEIEGAIAGFDAQSKTFTLLGININFSTAQVYGQLGNGVLVKVDGSFANGTLTARQVEMEEPDDNDENIRARGQVSNLDSTQQTFEFLGFTVDYSQADVDDAFANGDSVEIRGWLENGTITADRVRA
jgi:Ca2+-binding RTX toxin-like protein